MTINANLSKKLWSMYFKRLVFSKQYGVELDEIQTAGRRQHPEKVCIAKVMDVLIKPRWFIFFSVSDEFSCYNNYNRPIKFNFFSIGYGFFYLRLNIFNGCSRLRLACERNYISNNGNIDASLCRFDWTKHCQC